MMGRVLRFQEGVTVLNIFCQRPRAMYGRLKLQGYSKTCRIVTRMRYFGSRGETFKASGQVATNLLDISERLTSRRYGVHLHYATPFAFESSSELM